MCLLAGVGKVDTVYMTYMMLPTEEDRSRIQCRERGIELSCVTNHGYPRIKIGHLTPEAPPFVMLNNNTTPTTTNPPPIHSPRETPNTPVSAQGSAVSLPAVGVLGSKGLFRSGAGARRWWRDRRIGRSW